MQENYTFAKCIENLRFSNFPLYPDAEPSGNSLIKSKIFLLDSTTISLCLSLFDWARYKTRNGAIRMNTLLFYDGNFSAYIHISDGKTADKKGAYDIPLCEIPCDIDRRVVYINRAIWFITALNF